MNRITLVKMTKPKRYKPRSSEFNAKRSCAREKGMTDKAGCIWPLWWTCTHVASSVGLWAGG
jgi:hypothetical protein